MKKIVIIGGGIAGLAAAYHIHKEIARKVSIECALLESFEKFGGKYVPETLIPAITKLERTQIN